MKSLWNDADAARLDSDLERRVYTSRLLGADPSLVLHGGGNTSVKVVERDRFGEERELLYVKGSGWDLATIEPPGFAPVRMDVLLKLARLDSLSDAEMARELRAATVDPSAPSPSVEAILHAVLPHRFVDHTHPDALISIMNTPSGLDRVRELYADDAVIVPYVMPGFALAQACARLFPAEAHERTVGMVLMHHGLFSFGETARESYERMIELVARAEDLLRSRGAWGDADAAIGPSPAAADREELAALRQDVSRTAGRPLVLTTRSGPAALAFARRPDLERVATSGPATPDHVLRTKRVPLIGRDADGYAADYARYFEANAMRSSAPLTMLDPAPRVMLDPELGLVAAGATAADAAAVAEIYEHTIDIVERAERLEAWQALPAEDVFDVEYWELEQAKLRRGGEPPPFTGEVALVTGAASGIGLACVDAFRRRGAAVVGVDVDPSVEEAATGAAFLGVICDLTSEDAVSEALDAGVRAFGGVDMLVLNAGIFPAGTPIAELPLEAWQRVTRINLDANVTVLREAHALLRRSPRGGRVVVNASRNVTAPGPGAAAYSTSKAGLTQLARVAALEWGADRIRVNVVHPNAVFDTGIWTDEVLESRARSYGLTVDEYRRANVLGVEVRSRDVAEVIAELCGPTFARTTGAQVPVDGGNERVI
jgi:rhamnose utilization protein RhaD (predicted bifunctional aldolase and dehydrogenase)/NAD(P)-dependent dehydrogenase (short-subunit alcohol dehydrogenase family)